MEVVAAREVAWAVVVTAAAGGGGMVAWVEMLDAAAVAVTAAVEEVTEGPGAVAAGKEVEGADATGVVSAMVADWAAV